MATKPLWRKLGRWLTGVVILCFFLPFFGVSCEGKKGPSIDVITISGADMVAGCRPGGVLAEADQQGGIKGGDASIDAVPRELFAILALAFCVTAFALAWVRSRGALVATLVVALAGLGSLGALYVKVRGELIEEVDKANKESPKGMKEDMEVSAGSRFGFWAVAVGLLAVVALTGRELRARAEAPPAG